MFKILKSRKFLTIFLIILIAIILLSGYFTLQRMFRKTPLWGVPQAGGVLPLIADAEHDVAVLEECDLAVKIAKNRVKISYNKDKKLIFERADSSPNVIDKFLIYISCSKPSDLEFKQVECSGLAYNFIFKTNKKLKACLTKSTFVTPDQDNFVQFEASNLYFGISHKFLSPASSDGTSFLKDIQVQFNSLAPSVPSVKL